MRSAFQQIKLPPKVRSGEPVRAADHNQLIDTVTKLLASLKYLTLQPSPDLGIRRGPNGTTAWIKGKRRGVSTTATPDQFEIVGLRYDATAETWKCKVEPGYVVCRNPKAGEDVLKYWMPTNGDGVELKATPEDDPAGPPEFEVAAGDVLGIRVLSTEKDIIEEAPIVEIGAEDEESIHSQPPNSPVEGEYFYRLALFEELPLPEGSPPGAIPQLVVAEIFHEGPLYHSPHLPELKNIGGHREVFDRRVPETDAYDLRTLEQLVSGEGVAIIRPLEEEEEEGDTIPFRCILKNNSSSTPYTLTGEGDAVKLTFTGASGTYFDGFGGFVDFLDGLCTGITPSGATGANINIRLLNIEITEVAGDTYVNNLLWGSGGTEDRFLYVRNGLIMLVDDAAAVDTYEVISRIQGETFSAEAWNQSGDGFTEAPAEDP